MNRTSVHASRVVWAAVMVLLATTASAQPPRPAMQVTQMPQFQYGTWPGDFNGDGQSDLIGATSSGALIVALGHGDGTFGAPVPVGVNAVPIAVGDFNNDGKLDVVVTGVSILPGNGNGTFGTPRIVTGPPQFSGVQIVVNDALAKDFNGDGKRDLALLAENAIDVYAGNGDFTFAPPVSLPSSGQMQVNAIAANFNGDQFLDIAAVEVGGTVDVYLNHGHMLFTVASIAIGGDMWSIAAGDLNRDGKQDLVIAATGMGVDGWPQGKFLVLPGNGDGTFKAPVTYQTGVPGAITIVVGDFNKDGLLDVATGNLSWRYHDDQCTPSRHLWDSVTVLPGLGNGGFGPPATFRLSTAPFSTPSDQWGYADNHNALKTSDFNGDGRTDLFASKGVLLLNVPPFSTSPIIGGFAQFQEFSTYRFSVSISDPDSDWLNIEWRDASGTLLSRLMEFCLPVSTSTVTVKVTDAHGYVRTDTVAVPPANPEPLALPPSWFGGDVGPVDAFGTASYANGTYTVTGNGSDIWGTYDAFFGAFATAETRAEITARVASVQNVDPWTKAGLMFRDGPLLGDQGASARHASIFVTPTTVKGIAFQRRPVAFGTSVSTAGPLITAPVWLKLRRYDNGISAYYRKTLADPWTFVGQQTFTSLSSMIAVGLAVSSHVPGVRATAMFDHVAIDTLYPFQSSDIGAVVLAGTTVVNGPTVTLEGSGADIWGTSDAFRFYRTAIAGDATITARVRSVENTNAWAKAGVMIRQTLSASSPHVMVVVTPGKGVAMQYRSAAGGASAQAGVAAGVAPRYVRLRRIGNTFTGSVSIDGDTWTTIGSVTVSMTTSAYAGLPVTAHNNVTLATAVFDDITIR